MEEPEFIQFKELVQKHIEEKNISALKPLLVDAEEQDILELVEELHHSEQAVVFRLLPKDEAVFVFEQLDTSVQEELIHSLSETQACEIFENMDPDDRVRLLDELPAVVAKKMLSSLSKEERAKTNLLMGYEPETAGRIMTPDYISLRREMTAAEAIEKVKRQAEDKETIYTLYVTDNGRKYEGFVRLRSLLIAKSDTKIEDIMDTGIDPVMTSTDQEEAARELQRLDILAIPVVDKENRMVGIITVDDAMDILEQETTEDMLSKAKMRDSGNSSETLIKGNLWSVWKVRLPFLAFTILGGLFSAIVLGGFEDAVLLIALPAVFFVPLVMDMGGTIGVQSSTIFIRGMTLGQINTKKMGRHIVREVGIGVSIGLVVGLLIGLVAFLWQGIILPSEIPPYLSPGIPHPLHGVAAWRIGLGLGAAIWLAMIVVCTFAAFMGFTVPFVLHKLKKDQAVATGPVITTIKDVVGLTVYLGFVWIFVIQIFGL